MIVIELIKVEEGIIPIYENESKEKLINARELHYALNSKRDFSNWIMDRIRKYRFIENEDFSTILLESTGGRPRKEYILKLDVAKEIALIENNERGRTIRKYFIEVEKRYRGIINTNNSSNQLQYIKNTKSGKKGEIKERDYKIENISYKVIDI